MNKNHTRVLLFVCVVVLLWQSQPAFASDFFHDRIVYRDGESARCFYLSKRVIVPNAGVHTVGFINNTKSTTLLYRSLYYCPFHRSTITKKRT